MLVSTKGRYALRLMVCVARAGAEGKVALREVSEREDISLKYLEQLARPLVQAGLLRSVRGKGGGYALAREASAVRAGDVLRAVEGTTAPVACLDLEDGMACPRERVHHGAFLGRPRRRHRTLRGRRHARRPGWLVTRAAGRQRLGHASFPSVRSRLQRAAALLCCAA